MSSFDGLPPVGPGDHRHRAERIADLMEVFSNGRATVYRVLERAGGGSAC